jgi:hypothetical protein
MSALTKMSFTLLGFLKTKTGGSLKILHSSGCWLGELKCHLKKRGYNNASINHCFSKASGIDRKDLIQYKEKNANNRVPFVITYHPALSNLSSIVTFQFPKPFFGGLFVGADAFDSESLAVRNTFGAMLRMTTLWGQVLMFICRCVVYVS